MGDEPRRHLDQPIGVAVPGWTPRPRPAREPMTGAVCRLEPLDADRHAADLFAANRMDESGRMWTYLSYGPFDGLDEYAAWIEDVSRRDDPLFFAVKDAASGKAVGVASYLRTEAMYLMMQRAFALGYRRYEWKCDALNAPSRAAAQRFGFSYEGVFRQAIVYKGRNRDSAWYAAIDREWPALDAAFTRWLDPANFDSEGRQRVRLADLTEPILKQRG
jgi:RimJ/RimL family protein N-acetyltransferase